VKSSRSFSLNKGLEDPNPGSYEPPFRKSTTTEPVSGPDWGSSKEEKEEFWEGEFWVGFMGVGRNLREDLVAGIFLDWMRSGKKSKKNFPEFFFKKILKKKSWKLFRKICFSQKDFAFH
jgi:hypothetical protein